MERHVRCPLCSGEVEVVVVVDVTSDLDDLVTSESLQVGKCQACGTPTPSALGWRQVAEQEGPISAAGSDHCGFPDHRGSVPTSAGAAAACCSTEQYMSLCVTEIRSWVVDEAAPHDDVRLLILDKLPCSQDTLPAETAALGDPLRALVVEMSDELQPHHSIVSKGPLSDEIERLHRDTTASNPTIKPVERLGSTGGEVELNADLTSAFV